MAAINSTRELAKIRAKIDIQQQIVSQLETDLQLAIVGGFGTSSRTLDVILADIQTMYTGAPDGAALAAAMRKGNDQLDLNGNGSGEEVPESEIIRNMLGQARSLLGELRIEEQSWNQEVNEEKARRKDLTELAKG